MALNPPITPAGVPLRVDGEFFVLQRQNIEIEIKINNMGKYSAKGNIYLTTARIVFVSTKHTTEVFKAFDIPIAFLTNEKFQQPIFGSNYLEGDVKPLYNLLPGDTHFKLWFQAGGCSLFLKVLVEILKQVRQRRQQGQMGPDPRWVQNINSGQANAYMDPNDPSIIYVQQPNEMNNQLPPQFQQTYGQPVFNPQQQPQQYNQPPQQYQPPPQQYPPQQQQYNQQQQQNHPQYIQQPQQQYGQQQQYQQQPQYQPQQQNQQQQPPSTYPQQQQYNYPAQQPQQQTQNQQQPQQAPQNPQNTPNLGYYYGTFGPQLQSNQQQNGQL